MGFKILFFLFFFLVLFSRALSEPNNVSYFILFFGVVFLLLCLLMAGMTGIMFQDITTLLLDPKAFKDTIDLFVERYKGKNISVVAGEY